MLPSHAIELVQAALLASFWRKPALQRFLRRMHITDSALANLNETTTKRQYIDWLFQKLEASERGHSIIRAIANDLAAQTRFPDLEGWEDSELKKKQAQESVESIRSWLKLEDEGRESELLKRQRREAAERARAIRASHESSLSTLRKDLDTLATQLGTQAGGYAFQDWFGRLCKLFELEYKKPYRASGRETDGSLTIGDMTFLLSLKFENHQTAPGDISELKGHLHKVADYTMGILLSMAGFGKSAIQEASGAQTSILLIDHNHLYYVLSGAISLSELVSRVRRHASRTGEAYLAIGKFGN